MRRSLQRYCCFASLHCKFCSLFLKEEKRANILSILVCKNKIFSFFGTLRDEELRLELITEKLRGSFPSYPTAGNMAVRAGPAKSFNQRTAGPRTFWHGKGALTRVRVDNNLLFPYFSLSELQLHLLSFVRYFFFLHYFACTDQFDVFFFAGGRVRSVVRAATNGPGPMGGGAWLVLDSDWPQRPARGTPTSPGGRSQA